MRVVVEISLDGEKVVDLRERLNAIVSTVDAGTPQENKNRRIKNLVSIAQRLIDEMVDNGIATKFKEFANG
jgi:hypothetical protein